MVHIIVQKEEILKTLKHLKAVIKGRSKRALRTICEGTITDGKITFAVPGSIFSLSCQTHGVAKFTLQFIPFYKFIRTYQSPVIKLIVGYNEIYIDSLTIKAKTCFMKEDKILKTVRLPYNYTDQDILSLPLQGFTWEELEFNGIVNQIIDIKFEDEMNDFKIRQMREGEIPGLFDNFE